MTPQHTNDTEEYKNIINENKSIKAELHNYKYHNNKNSIQIPIFLASDDNYAPFLTTTMFSVLENTSELIDFHILDNKISTQSKEKLLKSLERFQNKKITFHDTSNYNLSKFPDVAHYTTTAFARYFIPEMIKGRQKVIYLDSDMIIKGDIKELYEQDLGQYPLGAVLEDFASNYIYLKENIYPEYAGKDQYFNSGMLLIDLKKFQENNYTEQLVNMTVKLHDKLNAPDQDVFNIIFQNNFKVLDYKYNFMPDLEFLIHQKHPNLLKIKPLILHYIAGKPWKKLSCRNRDFWDVLICTEFEDFVKEKFPPEIKKTKKEHKILQTIFSIKNKRIDGIKYKTITIF